MRPLPGFSGLLLCTLLTVVCAAPVHAQPNFAESFFVLPTEESEKMDVCANNFAAELTGTGEFVQRNTPEVQALVSECIDSIGSAQFARDCDLAMARAQVDLMFILTVRDTSRGWLFDVTAMSPLLAASVWGHDVLLEGEPDGVLAARDACTELGRSFRSHRSIAPAEEEVEAYSVIEVQHVSPIGARVYVDGEMMGHAPGQFAVTVGELHVALRAEGHDPFETTVTAEDAELVELHGIALTPHPATLVVRAGTHGAEIVVDGEVVGTTEMGRGIPVEIPANTLSFHVRRDGYETYKGVVFLEPAGTTEVTVPALVPRIPGNHSDAPLKPPDLLTRNVATPQGRSRNGGQRTSRSTEFGFFTGVGSANPRGSSLEMRSRLTGSLGFTSELLLGRARARTGWQSVPQRPFVYLGLVQELSYTGRGFVYANGASTADPEFNTVRIKYIDTMLGIRAHLVALYVESGFGLGFRVGESTSGNAGPTPLELDVAPTITFWQFGTGFTFPSSGNPVSQTLLGYSYVRTVGSVASIGESEVRIGHHQFLLRLLF